MAVTASRVGRLQVGRSVATAAGRAVLQLALVALVITAVLSHLGWSLVFALVMLAIAVGTSARRIGARRAWPWVGVAIASGVLPVLAVVFLSGTVPWNGASLVPMAGIIIGGAMSVHSLLGRRVFAPLRGGDGAYEAAPAPRLPRPAAATHGGGPRPPGGPG